MTNTLKAYIRLRHKHFPDSFGGTLRILFIIAAFFLPLFAGQRVVELTNVWNFAIAMVGLNILTGLNGQPSMGHGVFYGLGGLVMALLSANGVSCYLALFCIATSCLLVGVLFGLCALRLRQKATMLVTFLFALSFPMLVGKGINMQVQSPVSDLGLYYGSLTFLALSLMLLANLTLSRSGRAIRAVREQVDLARALGIDDRLHNVYCFGISGMLAGIGGGLAVLNLGHFSEIFYNPTLSVVFLGALAIGGTGSILGPIYGGIFLQYYMHIAGNFSGNHSAIVYEAILVLLVLLNPHGIAGGIREARSRLNNFWSYIRF